MIVYQISNLETRMGTSCPACVKSAGSEWFSERIELASNPIKEAIISIRTPCKRMYLCAIWCADTSHLWAQWFHWIWARSRLILFSQDDDNFLPKYDPRSLFKLKFDGEHVTSFTWFCGESRCNGNGDDVFVGFSSRLLLILVSCLNPFDADSVHDISSN